MAVQWAKKEKRRIATKARPLLMSYLSMKKPKRHDRKRKKNMNPRILKTSRQFVGKISRIAKHKFPTGKREEQIGGSLTISQYLMVKGGRVSAHGIPDLWSKQKRKENPDCPFRGKKPSSIAS